MAIPTRRAWAKPARLPAPAPVCGVPSPLATYQAARSAALFAIRLRHRAHLHRMDEGICENAVRVSYERLQVAVACQACLDLGREGIAMAKAPRSTPARVPPHTSCHTLRRVLVRHSTMNPTTSATTPTGQEWTTRARDVPLFSDAERATGVCSSCASGWTHPENHPLVPVFDAAAHARFSLRHWQAMQERAATPADLARAAEGIAVWSARVATLAQLATPIASAPGPTPAA